MLRRVDAAPFIREREGEIRVEFLEDRGGRTLAFLDRLLRLLRRLEGRSRREVREALRRQERRVRDARRLSGIARTLLARSRFEPPGGADRAREVRDALFRARGRMWPPVPGDERAPYEAAAGELGLSPAEVDRLLRADEPDALLLVRAPRLSPEALLRGYNLDLARAVLLDALEVELRARGGWKGIFRSVKLARLMHELAPDGPGRWRVRLTGPAAPFVTRPQRYGARFARAIPALVRAPGWSMKARIAREKGEVGFRLDGGDPVAPRPGGRPRYDSGWERDLAREFREKIGEERGGWRLRREETPVSLGEEVFLPDFTLRHGDGREALVELMGFWTPEYLVEKVRRVRAAGLRNLVLVVFRDLGAFRTEGLEREELEDLPAEVVWFRSRVRIGPVMEAVERVALPP